MNTAIGFPEGSASVTYANLSDGRAEMNQHDQAECDYLDALWALDTVKGGDDE